MCEIISVVGLAGGKNINLPRPYPTQPFRPKRFGVEAHQPNFGHGAGIGGQDQRCSLARTPPLIDESAVHDPVAQCLCDIAVIKLEIPVPVVISITHG